MGELLYSFEITNGYVFRQIFELYDKLIVNVIPVYLKETGITLRTGSGKPSTTQIISDVEIFSEDIISYYINVEKATVPKTENTCACYIEQFNLNSLKTIFKSIAKSNSVKIYKTTKSNDILVEVKGITVEHSRIPPTKYQVIEHDITMFESISVEPNIKIEINQFCSTIKGMTRGDTEYTTFKVYEKGLVIEGKKTSGAIIKDGKWNITNEELEKNHYSTDISGSIIKALCKISGTANYSIIKVFCNTDGYLKLSHKIGDFGEHNIYIIHT